ncbi:hypothetical protein FIBSPDRAFT_521300 [Athelia psychrophila]|uniref:LigT-like protein n=1 Tax=Athelia psychrophila TaxID=1759441 RepID=A0A166JU40_9AGAM|nr:hypothetical protein FIBSPDRAFT_521300 [Fibularhizoctonia sp. CBS 109695]
MAGIALWLVPPPAQREDLQRIMDSRPPPSASKSKSPKSYPHFEPHITLASSLPSSLSTAAILASVPKKDDGTTLHIHFKSIEVGDHYFRSVCLDIQPSPSLLKLRDDIHAALRRHEGTDPKSPRFPHMSLYYIDDSEPEERHIITNHLVASGQAASHDGGVRLGGLSGFDDAEIWVVRCEGPVGEWETLGKMNY